MPIELVLSTSIGTSGIRAALTCSAVLLMTVAHHSYGAVRFATPWRHHVTFVALLLAVILWSALLIWRKQPTVTYARFARGLFRGIAFVGPILWIGFFEGGYNHTLKLILMVARLPAPAIERLYPPGIYEAPQDWLFEMTGVAQFVLAVWALRSLLQFMRAGCHSSTPSIDGKVESH